MTKILHDEDSREKLIKLLDLTVGIPLVILERDRAAKERRKYYGEAGSWRPQKWGVEWRVPSAYWLRSPILTNLILGMCRCAVTIRLNDLDEYLWDGLRPKDVILAINNNDKNRAMRVWNLIKRNFYSVSKSNSLDPFTTKARIETFEWILGQDNFFSDNLHDNWQLWRGNTAIHAAMLPQWESWADWIGGYRT